MRDERANADAASGTYSLTSSSNSCGADTAASEKPPAAAETPSAPPKPATEPKTAKPAAPAKSATASGGGWSVQVGAFSHLENAKRLQQKLKQKGYSSTLDPPSPPKGKTVRVEVGPFKDAEAAKTAQARIQNELGIKGVVRKP